MKVENLSIEAPLTLLESKTSQVQTVIQLNTSSNSADWNDMSVGIFHRVEGSESVTPSWLSHAKATFSPLVTALERKSSIDFDNLKRRLEKENNVRKLVQYQKNMLAVGLKFGPSFKTFERVLKTDAEPFLFAKLSMPPQVEGQNQQDNYIIHPTLLDAMIQAIMFSKLSSATAKKLFIPIKIGQFVWLAGNETEETYIHAYDTESGRTHDEHFEAFFVSLLDGNGKVLAYMSGVEFIDTTVKALEAVLEQQTISMPDLWEEVWRPKLGPNQYRVDLMHCNIEDSNDEEYRRDLEERYNNLGDELQETFSNLERLVYCYMLQALYELGWAPPLPGAVVSKEGLAAELGIRKVHQQYFGYVLTVLQDEGILKQKETDLDEWQVVGRPPTLEEIATELNCQRYKTHLPNKLNSTRLLFNIGAKLSGILTGKQFPLQILFPDQPNADNPSVENFYEEYGTIFQIDKVGLSVGAKFMGEWKQCQAEIGEKFVMRILEVGAGTGIFTRNLIRVLDDLGIEFELTFTDISAAFFPAAQETFGKWKHSMQYKKLNIEEDPIRQGFIPGYFDYICAFDVIHATRDVRESLRNVNCLLKPMGRFDLQDTTRVHRLITFLFGLLEGFWRFTDRDLRPSHCSLSAEGWGDAFGATGFEVTGVFPSVNGYHSFISTRKSLGENCSLEVSSKVWLLFHHESSPISNFLLEKIPQLANRQVQVIMSGKEFSCNKNGFCVRRNCEQDFTSVMEAMNGRIVEGIIYCWSLDGTVFSQDEILQPYFYLAKSIGHLKQDSSPRLLTLTNGVVPLGENSLDQFPTSTIWGFTKSLRNENIGLNCRLVDIGEEAAHGVMDGMMQIFYEIWNGDKETQVSYDGATRQTPKFQPLKPTNSQLAIPAGTDRFQLVLPGTNTIQDLQFGPLEPGQLREEEVEIQVKAYALNFKDVLNVLKPSQEFTNSNAVGYDFAGLVKRVGTTVTKVLVGDEVFGINMSGNALPSHVKLSQDDVLQVGDRMTLCEAATLPAVSATSYYCLVDVAKVTSKDTVLIHTASGGVGLSAIQLCKHLGAKIICTAGSKRKQNYLRSLGIQHVFHSRNTKYGEEILKVTGGRGVDVVLNSLTSEGFKEATLMACAEGARFIEMSKLSIWQPEEVKALRPDVKYTIIDLSAMDIKEFRPLLNAIKFLADENVISPIPYVRFDGVNIREALQYIQKAKHIGKIVCVMPEIRQRNGQTVTETPMFNSKSTYLITGGLGGIGFEVCKWMVEKGAKFVLLAGRNSPDSGMAEAITQINSKYKARVIPVKLDVSNYSQCEELFHSKVPEIGCPQLRGVMHCAGTLQDGLIQNQDWPKLSCTFRTKVDGTMNLHKLTEQSRLEHFVLFSSIASLFGSPCQSNHAAGNNFEDSFAHYRNSIGLPATTINWGQWGQVGVATEADFPGMKPLSNLQGISALEYAMKSHQTQTGVAKIDSFVMLKKLFPHIASYLDERVWKSSSEGSGSNSFSINPEEFWELYESKGSDLEEKLQVAQVFLRKILRNILKLDEADVIQDLQDLQEMGVDSLMFVEIKNALQALLGDRVAVTAGALRDCNTVRLLAATLVKLVEGDESGAQEVTPLPTTEQVERLIREDCELPEHICAKKGRTSVAEKDIHSVLLTGCTGTLGPYILRELCRLPQISSVTCLVRPSSKQSTEQRLKDVLRERDLLKEIDIRKVSVVSGDVVKPRLGLDPEHWDHLSNTVDAIVHCAVSVQYMESYQKRDSTKDMRAINIQGTKNVLELSCSGGKLKHIFHASSIAAGLKVDEDGCLLEEWSEIGGFDGITKVAYPITKFVGEYLLKTAIDRGIPAKAIRFPVIVGNSKTGRFILSQNHAMLRYLFVLQTGLIPDIPIPMVMIPVDTCAEVGVKLFFDERWRNDVINLTPNRPNGDQDFVQVAKKLGYDVEIVGFSEFAKKLRDSSVENTPFAIFKEFYEDEEEFLGLFATIPLFRQWIVSGGGDEANMLFHSKKLAKLIPTFNEKLEGSMACIYRDLLFAREQGWLQKYGLE